MVLIKKILTLSAFASICAFCLAQELTGFDIVKKSQDAENAKTSSYTATMTLTDKKGKTRVREVIMRSKDFGEMSKSVIVFTMPKDVSGVGYLMFDHKEDSAGNKKDGESWLYMPATKKSRRISGNGKADDFMGTDFTYEDIDERGLNKDNFTRLEDETVNGIDCYKVQAVSKDSTEKNPRRIIWISKETFLMVQCEFFDRQDALQRVLTCSDFAQIDGYWATQKMFMKNVQSNHSTLLEIKNISYDIPLDDSIFTVSALERGAIR